MKIQSALLAISLFLFIVPDLGAQATLPQITVGFVNKAGVDTKALRQGLEFAAMILKWTGVSLAFLDCPIDGTAATAPCSGFTGPNQISVRLIRRRQKESGEIGFQKLGFADRLDGRPGSGIVYLFCETIEPAARERGVPLRDILGVVITHEIGHLLISPGHSERGIMRSQLEEREWHKASQGMLRFTPEQAKVIKEGVVRRSRSTQAALTGND